MILEYVKVNSKRWLNLQDLLNEEWKDIPKYEKIYMYSNYGRLKTLEKVINSGLKNQKSVKRKEQIVKAQINKLGYIHYNISKNGKYHNINAHKLVAELYLDKKDFKYYDEKDKLKYIDNLDKLEVNHIDENTSNCRIDNLEWCTTKYNCNYGMHNKNLSMSISKKDYGIKVAQYDLKGAYIKTYKNILTASKITKASRHCISKCCKGIYKQAGGYIWKFI